jgi:hypothetical protein
VYVSPAAALPGEHFIWGTDPTSDFTRRQVRQGRCLMSGRGSLSEADTVVTERRLPFGGSDHGDLVVGIQTAGETLYQRRAGRWSVVARATTVRYTTVKAPLRFWSVGRELRVVSSERGRSTLEPVVEHALGPWLGGS